MVITTKSSCTNLHLRVQDPDGRGSRRKTEDKMCGEDDGNVR